MSGYYSGGGGGGGPWGNGPSPWGNRGGTGGNGGGTGGGGRVPQPPNLDELFRRGQDGFRSLMPGGVPKRLGLIIVIAVIVLIWLASGFYRVEPDEQGVVLRFGAISRITPPGLGWHIPVPIESVLTPKVTRVNPIEIGFRVNTESSTRIGASHEVPEEALMLTGDENIVDINFTVFWVIKDATKYLFNIRNPELTVKSAAESAMREVIGRIDIAKAFAEARGQIKNDTLKLTQEILDAYGSGIEITDLQLQKVDPPGQVIDAFRDVQSAKIDLNRLTNEAQSYANDVVPRAHGDASRIVQEAEAYRQQVVRQAEGDASRFTAVYLAYKASEDVTSRRLYIETMQSILKGANKIVLDSGTSNVLPYLPLQGLTPMGAVPAAAANASPPMAPPPPLRSGGSRP